VEELYIGHRGQRVSDKPKAAKDYELPNSIFCRHSFKLLPNIGKHVVELIDGSLSQDLANAWRWRPGGDALKSTRDAPAKDLADMPGWKHGEDSETKLANL